jgi:hypothetical protein
MSGQIFFFFIWMLYVSWVHLTQNQKLHFSNLYPQQFAFDNIIFCRVFRYTTRSSICHIPQATTDVRTTAT